MKKFNINCQFGASSAMVPMYVGNPHPEQHPIHFQASWLAKERGGTVPQEVMDSLQKIKELSEQNGVPFEELCTYALEEAGKVLKAEQLNPPIKEAKPSTIEPAGE